MRSRDGTEKGSCRESRDGTQLSATTLVLDPEGTALPLRCRGGEFTAEDFTKIAFFLLDRPQFQVDTASLLGN
jgi:hypothetical protein